MKRSDSDSFIFRLDLKIVAFPRLFVHRVTTLTLSKHCHLVRAGPLNGSLLQAPPFGSDQLVDSLRESTAQLLDLKLHIDVRAAPPKAGPDFLLRFFPALLRQERCAFLHNEPQIEPQAGSSEII